MFTIDSQTNKIILTKGDTATLNVSIVDADGNSRPLTSTDTLRLKVRKTPSASLAINKTADRGVIALLPADTLTLDSGLYLYCIELITANNMVYTITESFFQLMEDL